MDAAHRYCERQYRSCQTAGHRIQQQQGDEAQEKQDAAAQHLIGDQPIVDVQHQPMGYHAEDREQYAGEDGLPAAGPVNIRKIGGHPGGDTVLQHPLKHDGEQDQKQHAHEGKDGPLLGAPGFHIALPDDGFQVPLQPPVPKAPKPGDHQGDQSRSEEDGSPAARGDEEGRRQVYEDGAQGAPPGDLHRRPLVLLDGEVLGEDPQLGRPDQGLGKAVHAPDQGHPAGIGTEGDQGIHQGADEKPKKDEMMRLDPIPQVSADQLPGAVGDEQAGGRHGYRSPGKTVAPDDLHQDGGKVDPGQIAGEIDQGAKKNQFILLFLHAALHPNAS